MFLNNSGVLAPPLPPVGGKTFQELRPHGFYLGRIPRPDSEHERENFLELVLDSPPDRACYVHGYLGPLRTETSPWEGRKVQFEGAWVPCYKWHTKRRADTRWRCISAALGTALMTWAYLVIPYKETRRGMSTILRMDFAKGVSIDFSREARDALQEAPISCPLQRWNLHLLWDPEALIQDCSAFPSLPTTD